jgi:hypothetical protein
VSIAYTLRIDPVVVLTETNKVHRAVREAASDLIIAAKKAAQKQE